MCTRTGCPSMLWVDHSVALSIMYVILENPVGIICRDTEGVKRQLGEATGEVMGRLSAASMESYSRAYPHLVRLHMLHEASDAAQVAARGSLGPIERQRVLRWDERLRITQSSLATQVCSARTCLDLVLL